MVEVAVMVQLQMIILEIPEIYPAAAAVALEGTTVLRMVATAQMAKY